MNKIIMRLVYLGIILSISFYFGWKFVVGMFVGMGVMSAIYQFHGERIQLLTDTVIMAIEARKKK